MQDNEIRQKKEACYTDVEKYVLRSCALCCFLFGGTHLTRCFCVLMAVSRLVRSGLWGVGVQILANGGELRAALPLP